MREKKFTPGPWAQNKTHQCSNDAWHVITDAKGYGPIMDVGGKDKNGQIAEAKYLITDEEEIQANANLIAVSPEMLVLLEVARCPACDGGGAIGKHNGGQSGCSSDYDWEQCQWCDEREQVLAKAYGETP